jgi:hypothetical protein
MPRTMRVEHPGAIYHVMDRGGRREDAFVDEVDRQDLLKTLAEAGQKNAWQVHAYHRPGRAGPRRSGARGARGTAEKGQSRKAS